MKRLARAAQEKGEPIQRIHCASDPDSLDGVVFLRQKRAIIDATAPHVVEPEAPGAAQPRNQRRVAQAMEEKGASVEYIACSGDPDSLDAVVFPALNTAIVDGTAPHG